MMRAAGSWCAFVGVGVVMFCTTFANAQPKPELMEKAKEHMAAGSAFYNDPSGHKCEEAVREFAKAFEYSGSWRALRAQAICELELERDGDAIAHYEQVLKIGSTQLDAGDKGQIENDLRALKSAAATMVVTSNKPGARLTTTRQPSSGFPISNRYTVPEGGLTFTIHPGQYTFAATVEGFPELTWKAEVGAQSKAEKVLEFKPAPEGAVIAPPPPGGAAAVTERPVPVSVWIVAGITVASAVTSGTFMGLSAMAKSDYDELNGTGASQAKLEDLRSDVITKNVVADVFLGVTAAGLGTTLILYFTRSEVTVGKEAAFTILPQAGPDSVGATVFGSF